ELGIAPVRPGRLDFYVDRAWRRTSDWSLLRKSLRGENRRGQADRQHSGCHYISGIQLHYDLDESRRLNRLSLASLSIMKTSSAPPALSITANCGNSGET